MSFLSRPASGRHLILRPSSTKPKIKTAGRCAHAAAIDPEPIEQPIPTEGIATWLEGDVISAPVDPRDWPDWTDRPIPYRVTEG